MRRGRDERTATGQHRSRFQPAKRSVAISGFNRYNAIDGTFSLVLYSTETPQSLLALGTYLPDCPLPMSALTLQSITGSELSSTLNWLAGCVLPLERFPVTDTSPSDIHGGLL